MKLRRLVHLFHSDGRRCPGCGADEAAGGLGVHRRRREPVIDHQRARCGRVFNTFTGTILHGTRKKPSTWLLALRGFAQGVPAAQLARELDVRRPHLLAFRHRVQQNAAGLLDHSALADATTEADEIAGEKRRGGQSSDERCNGVARQRRPQRRPASEPESKAGLDKR